MGRRQPLVRWSLTCLLALVGLSTSTPALAQDDARATRLVRAVKGTALDPTTYVPALLSYDSTMRDWDTSQPFFRNGFFEKNARFTVTGLSYGQAIGYEAGRTQILKDALSVLEVSAVQNLSERLVEQALLRRFPEHQKMVKAIGWVERMSVASLMSYRLAGPHYRQWRENDALASALGYR